MTYYYRFFLTETGLDLAERAWRDRLPGTKTFDFSEYQVRIRYFG